MCDSSNRIEITLEINGRSVTHSVPVRSHAADFLRHGLGLTGTHVGCEQGICGMCTISVDGRPMKSCLMLAAQLDGAVVQTVEALAPGEAALDPLQEAFRRHHALQCGYCTPGFLMLARSFAGRKMTRDDIAEEISGTLCRCTGYEGILRAIEDWLPGTWASPGQTEAKQ